MTMGEGLSGPLVFYREYFEKHFLEATQEFYDKEARQQLSTCSLSEYMKMVSLGSSFSFSSCVQSNIPPSFFFLL